MQAEYQVGRLLTDLLEVVYKLFASTVLSDGFQPEKYKGREQLHKKHTNRKLITFYHVVTTCHAYLSLSILAPGF
jgi:hypothetical protein